MIARRVSGCRCCELPPALPLIYLPSSASCPCCATSAVWTHVSRHDGAGHGGQLSPPHSAQELVQSTCYRPPLFHSLTHSFAHPPSLSLLSALCQLYLLQYRGVSFAFHVPPEYRDLYSSVTNEMPLMLPVSHSFQPVALPFTLAEACSPVTNAHSDGGFFHRTARHRCCTQC